MFGYVTASAEMPEERRKRYRAYYCGLCRNLGRRYGAAGRMTLSYDAVFLYMLLSSLYEPEEQSGQERCLPHPLKEHAFVENPLADYAADVNLLLSYHKCMDDWQDEHRLSGRAEAGLLQKSFASIEARYPEKSAVLKRCLDEIHQVEKSGTLEPDRLANLTGEMLGTLYRWREDEWAGSLEKFGQSLGRFIYLMDAYDDLEGDLHHGRYNPLRELSKQEDFEELIRQSLMLVMGECAREFELLPLIRDVDILRNILYGGCWGRYQLKQQKREKDKPAVKRQGRQEGGA